MGQVKDRTMPIIQNGELDQFLARWMGWKATMNLWINPDEDPDVPPTYEVHYEIGSPYTHWNPTEVASQMRKCELHLPKEQQAIYGCILAILVSNAKEGTDKIYYDVATAPSELRGQALYRTIKKCTDPE